MPWLATCTSDNEAKECNEPIKTDAGIIVGGKNHHLRCYKVHSIIKTDDEWYAPFYATLSFSHDPENQWMTWWRADQAYQPKYDESQDAWKVGKYPDPDIPEYRNGEPDFIIVHDEELRLELGVINPTELYTIEVNVVDWFLGSDSNIRKDAGNYNID
jgi:hypothetical protein